MQIIGIKVTGVEKARKRYKKTAFGIKKGSRQTLHNVALAGKNMAKAIAPRDTGALMKSIFFRTPKANEAWIVSPQPKHPYHPNTPYHLMMHGLMKPDISAKIRTGSPKYMFKMFDWLKKRFPKQMKEMVKASLSA